MALTEITYTGDGTDVTFGPIPFDYLEATDVKVSLNGVITSAFTIDPSTKIITFSSAPGNGVSIRVFRRTDFEDLSATFISGSAIRAQDLNDNFNQNLYVTQEISNYAITNDGLVAMEGDLDMGGYKITNLAEPTANNHAATKKYIDDRYGNLAIPGFTRWSKTAVGGETTLSGAGTTGGTLGYSPNREQVYLNGAQLQRDTDYTANNGTSIVLNVALLAGDVVEVICVNNLNTGTTAQAQDVYWNQSGSGAVTRTVESKLRDVVSVKDFGAVGDGVTDDTAAIQAAVTYAYSSGKDLFWDKGSYSTSTSISNFHSVRHIGAGNVKRGLDTFYVQPVDTNSNKIYVATTGIAGNDGLSPSQPTTIQAAFDALANYGPVLSGTWQVLLAAGTYTNTSVDFPEGLTSQEPVLISGPDVGGHPNVPTAIFSPAAPATSGFLFVTSKALVKDIKFVNYDANSSSYALAVREQGQLFTDNVHVNDAYLGIVGYGNCVLKVVGGIIENCDEGIRSLFNCYHSIGDGSAVDTSSGPIIKNCTVGFSARESSTGHADYVTFEDNDFGISSEVNSRVNASGSDFKRNTVAIRMRGGNVLRTGCNFNVGTADANTENLRLVSFGQDFGADQNCLSNRVRHRDVTTAGSISGSTTETVMYTYSLAAGEYQTITGPTYFGKCIRVIARGNVTGTAGNKTFRVRLGGLAGTSMSALVTAAAGRWEYIAEIFIRGNTDQRVNGKLIQDGNVVELGAGTLTYNLASASAIDLVVTGTTANSGDTITYDYFAVEVEG